MEQGSATLIGTPLVKDITRNDQDVGIQVSNKVDHLVQHILVITEQRTAEEPLTQMPI